MSQTQSKTEVERYRGLTIMKGVNRYGEFYYVKERAPSFSRNLGFQPFVPIGRTLEETRRNIDEVYERIKDNLVYWSEVGTDLLRTLHEGAEDAINYLLERARAEDAEFIVFDGYGYYKPVRLFEDAYYYHSGVFVENPKDIGFYGHRLLRKIKESAVPEGVGEEHEIENVVLAVNKRGKIYVLAYVSFTARTRDDEPTFKLIYVPREVVG